MSDERESVECCRCHQTIDLDDGCEWGDYKSLYCWGCAHDEIDRLQAIVDMLPKTEDGVPITPWMPVWLICGGELSSVRISWIAADLSRVGTNSGWSVRPNQCYFTREAAERARNQC